MEGLFLATQSQELLETYQRDFTLIGADHLYDTVSYYANRSLLPMTDRDRVRKEEDGDKNPILPHLCEKALPWLRFL